MTTHTNALDKALDAYDKTVNGRLAMQDAILAYVEEMGLMMVPMEPTRAMISAFYYTKGDIRDAYHAMLSASPDPFGGKS